MIVMSTYCRINISIDFVVVTTFCDNGRLKRVHTLLGSDLSPILLPPVRL